MNLRSTHLIPLSPYAAFIIFNMAEKALVISDLHIGWEVTLIKKGIHVPPQTKKLLNKVKKLVASEKPERLIILGDIKHAVAKIGYEEWREVPMFFEEVCKIVRNVHVVLGNHDGNIEALLPEDVSISFPRGLIFGDVGLFHGHAWPEAKLLGCSTLVMGHIHPVVFFRDPLGFKITKQVWVRASCNRELLARFVLERTERIKKIKNPGEILKDMFNVRLKVERLIIMPSFNDILGGQAMNQQISEGKRFGRFICPVLRSRSVNLEQAELHLLDGTYLGSIERLSKKS